MARTISEIKKEITDAFLSDETLRLKYGFDPSQSFESQFSKVSIESIVFYVISSAIWVLETFFDRHKDEVSDIIGKRAHTLAWYRTKALEFQYGYDLAEDIAEYDNSLLTDDDIERSRIVEKCSCEVLFGTVPTIKIKVATAEGAMTQDQYQAFCSYMMEIADAGVRLSVITKNPDKIGAMITILYDPLLMNASGALYNESQQNAVIGYIDTYLAGLEYNGRLYPNMLEKFLMECPGVKVANVSSVYRQGEGAEVKDETGKMSISPDSGAFTFDNSIRQGLTITFKPFTDETE